MMQFRALREMYRATTGGAADPVAGRMAFLKELHEGVLGMVSVDGRAMPGFDEDGRPARKSGSARPSELSIRHLAEAIMGHEAVEEYYHPSGGFDFGNRRLLESAIDPTAFLNINTLNLAISGLVNAEIMEAFNSPEYIGRSLVTNYPTKMNGHKRIGVAKIAPQTAAAKGRQPGETHAEVGFTEMYQTTPETVEQALKCVVTKEAVFFDLTGEVLERANGVGDELAYGQEKEIADGVMGVTSSYNFSGTSYATYQTASPYINDHSNPFTDETDVDDARQLFVGMTDPVTGREIRVEGRTILVMPARELKVREQLFGTNVQIGTQNTAGNFPSRYKMTAPQIAAVSGGAYTVVALTAIWYNRATAADGLNLSAANAKEYWWVGDFPRAFQWHENWPLTPWQASADELTMKDRGLVAVYGANYRGRFFAKEPRYSVRNKN